MTITEDENVEALVRAKEDVLTLVHEVQRLSLKEGDVLVLKMGDPSVGWIPSAENSAELAKTFHEALCNAGHEDVPIVWTHYAVDLEVVNRDAAPAQGSVINEKK